MFHIMIFRTEMIQFCVEYNEAQIRVQVEMAKDRPARMRAVNDCNRNAFRSLSAHVQHLFPGFFLQVLDKKKFLRGEQPYGRIQPVVNEAAAEAEELIDTELYQEINDLSNVKIRRVKFLYTKKENKVVTCLMTILLCPQ